MQSMRWHDVLGIFRSCWLKWGCRQSSHEEEVAINKRHADAIGRQSMQCNALSISNLPSAIKLKPSTSKLSSQIQISIGGGGLVVVRVWHVRWFLRLSPPPQALLWPAGLIVATLCLFVPFLCRHTKPTSRRPVLSSQLTLAREPFSPQDAQHGVKNETHGEKGPHICTTNLQK